MRRAAGPWLGRAVVGVSRRKRWWGDRAVHQMVPEDVGMWRKSGMIRDLQNAKLVRSEEFAKLQLRKLAYSTRFSLWARRNFTTLSHLLCLGVSIWTLLDTTEVVSFLLLAVSALNLQSTQVLSLLLVTSYQSV